MTRRYLVLTVASIVAVLAGAVAPWAYATFADTTAKDRIGAAPPPPLFPDATVAPMRQTLTGVRQQAEELMQSWWSSHGTRPDDVGFEAWLEHNLPAPPSTAQRTREIAAVEQLAGQRTAAGVGASTWLEKYGKKDVWKLYAHDQAEMLAPARGDVVKTNVDAMLSMAKKVADTLGARYQQSAPYVVNPSLRPDHLVAPGQVCPCSYPSRHAAGSAAARTYLGLLAPHRMVDYVWTESQIDYSRIYMAGHVVSDITAGSMLGDMIGEYFARTHDDTSTALN